jgi:4-hydroxybenzoate polyprenyltransferase
MSKKLKAYIDLMRLHFFFVWPLLFCSGLFLAFQHSNNFSWLAIVKAALIGFFGFEAGLVLNDFVDKDIDKKDVEFNKLTKYWRPFGTRPISQGLISSKQALLLFAILMAITTVLIFTLPFPQSIYVFGLMLICYSLEVFYQVKKRNQKYPISQLLGRIDFTLFPIAGYLTLGNPDANVILFFIFFYPLAQAHLGVNDLIDVANDEAKKMKTIPVLYGLKKTVSWILVFTIIHIIGALAFLTVLGTTAAVGFIFGFTVLTAANLMIMRGKNPEAGLKALPLFHLTMLIYIISIILEYFI